MHDTSTFGSFVDAFLTSVRDDFAKLPLFSWPLLSDATPFKPMDVRSTKPPRLLTISDLV
jgi:hypothetical protein